MSRAGSVGRWVLGGVALVLMVVVLAVMWVLGTEAGTRFAVSQARGWLPAGVSLKETSGRLGDRVELRGVSVEQPSATITIGRLTLDWSASALLRGTLHVQRLELQDVRYEARQADQEQPPEEPFRLPERIDLPVDVQVDEVALRSLTLITAPAAAPLTITRVTVDDTRFTDARLTAGALQVDAPAGAAHGQLSATFAGDYPVNVKVEWQLRPAGYAPLDGSTALTGSLAALEFDQRIGAPYLLRASGEVSHLLSADQPVAMDAGLEVEALRLSQVREQWPDATLSLQTSVQGPVDDLQIRAEARATDPQQRRFLADLSARLDDRTLHIARLQLRQPEADGRLTGQGSIALAAGVAADLQVSWTSLAWPLTGQPTVRSPRGRLSLQGPLDDYRFEAAAQVVADDRLPSLALDLSGSGTDRSAALDLAVRSSAGDVTGHGELTWAPELRGAVELQLAQLNPAVVVEDWPGQVSGRLVASGSSTDQGLAVTVESLDAHGTLRDLPLSAAIAGRFAQQGGQRQLEVATLQARLGPSQLQVDGHVRERAELSWQLASDDLASLGVGVRGTVRGAGSVSGPVPRVRIDGEIEGQDLAFAEHRIEQLAVVADVDLSGDAPSRLSAHAGPGEVAGLALSQLSLQATGKPGEHELELALDGRPMTAGVALTGGFDDPWGAAPVWHYTVTRGRLQYAELQPWQLARPAGGTLAAARMQVDEQCWQSGAAELCFAGHRDDQALAASVELANLDFAYFGPFLPEALVLRGAVDADGRVTWPDDGVATAQLEARTTTGAVRLAAAPELARPALELALQPSRVTVSVDAERAAAQLALHTGQGWIEAEAVTPAALLNAGDDAASSRRRDELPVRGRLQLHIPDLSYLAALLPQAQAVRGSVRGDMAIDGTLGRPMLHGSTTLADGAVTLPEPGLEVTELRAELTGAGPRGLDVQASAASGGGKLDVTGRLQLPGMPPTAHLTLTGTDFQVLNNADGRLFLSPDLEVTADERQVLVSGEVRVPRGELTPGSRAPDAVTASEDQVLVTRDPQEPLTERQLQAEIRLILGDEVRFEGFGLTAGLQGNVLIDQQPETPVTANGEIQLVDGEYRAYGQGLVIDEGRLFFAGPVTEPALDIRAVRRPEEGILVGARVQGTLQSPTFELFSEPTMSQQEQLSYLVLGRSLEETPDGESSALNQAVLAMGLKGGDFLAQNLGQRIGVDEIGIETGSGEAGAPSDPNEAALVVGKYLSPRLYVSYGIGLFDPTSVLQMQYEIASNWKLVTESSGEATGADLLYSVELGGN